MLEIFDRNKKRVAVTSSTISVVETERLNGVGQLRFSIPAEDEKAKHCKMRNFVRYDGGEMYRIIDTTETATDSGPVLLVVCEHALATLVDKIMFQDHILTGYSTKQALEYILANQSNWVLGKCDFDFHYDYAWASENLLTALWSVATPFVQPYKWTYSTEQFPWTVGLEKIDTEGKPEFHVIKGANLVEKETGKMGSEVVTRLYCLGYGEGVNQLDITSVNGGVPYLEAPKEVLEQHGVVEAVWIDRRYEDAGALKDAGQAILNNLMHPRVEYAVNVADLSPINGHEYFKPGIGKTVDVDGMRTYITEVERNHSTGEMRVSIANTPADVVSTIADLAERQRIEAAYSQGATQLWGSPVQDNASPSEPLIYNLWIPEETKIVNKVMVKIGLENFRAYSGTTEAAGGMEETSSFNGGVSKSTQSGGGTTQTSKGSGSLTSSNPTSNPTTSVKTTSTKAVDGELHSHTVGVPLADHKHVISNHTHDVTFPSHTHDFTVPDHTHDVEFPAHKHDIAYGIYRASEMPRSAEILVNGKTVRSMETDFEGDITALLVGEDGKIPRGQFIEIAVKPNTIAYVTISVAAQGFIQSRGGGRY